MAWGSMYANCETTTASGADIRSYFGGNSGTVAYSVTDQRNASGSGGCKGDAGVGWRIGTNGNYTFSHWSSSYAMTSYQNPPSSYTGGYHRERHGFTLYT